MSRLRWETSKKGNEPVQPNYKLRYNQKLCTFLYCFSLHYPPLSHSLQMAWNSAILASRASSARASMCAKWRALRTMSLRRCSNMSPCPCWRTFGQWACWPMCCYRDSLRSVAIRSRRPSSTSHSALSPFPTISLVASLKRLSISYVAHCELSQSE